MLRLLDIPREWLPLCAESHEPTAQVSEIAARETGLAAGTHHVNVRVQVSLRPVRVISVTPAALDLTLEPLVTRTLPVDVTLSGIPATGYLAGEATAQPTQVTAAGPQSLMERLASVRAILDLTGARRNIETVVLLQAVDVDDQVGRAGYGRVYF